MTTVVQTPPAAQPIPAPRRPMPKRWTLLEYQRAIESGVFRPDERLELIRGEIIAKMPQNEPHAWALSCLYEALSAAFAVIGRFCIRIQMPVVLPHDSQPEPDLVIVRGSARENPHHPTPEAMLLVVEVSDTSVTYDLEEKAALYAQEGIGDYWALLLPTRELRVHRNPQPAVGETPAFYRSIETYAGNGEVSPLAEPAVRLKVADLLPPSS